MDYEKALSMLLRSNATDKDLIRFYNKQIRKARNSLKRCGEEFYREYITRNLKHRATLREDIERRNALIEKLEERMAA